MHEQQGESPTVLVGYDGRARSLQALRWAASVAGAYDAQLNVVTTWVPHSGAYQDLALGADPDLLQRTAQDDVRSATAQIGYPARAVVVEGPAGRTLAGGATQGRVIVLATRGHLGAWGAITAGVARYCVAKAACPVVLLGPEAACAPVERVVVVGALDPTHSTFGWAARLAVATGSQVVDLGSATLAATVLAEASALGWPRVLTDRTHPADLLVLPRAAARVPQYRAITCPVALLPEPGGRP